MGPKVMRSNGAALRLRTIVVVSLLAMLAVIFVPAASRADATYSETTGSVANTWTNYTNAGGTAGPQIGSNAAVQIACKLAGFRVADGNTWWYRIASNPWNYAYYVSADAFYNDGATSGSLHGTPFVDPAVPDCGTGSGVSETTGSVANTWMNYTNAGGTAGPQIPSTTTVQIDCKLAGFKVADGNTWWYRIASAPWSDGFYVSADAFYNNGSMSGSLIGTPFVDPAVPDCSESGGGGSSSTVALAQGPKASTGYRYAITLSGFSANTAVDLECYDSVSPAGFYHFSLTTNGSGSAVTSNYCYSGDGPDHWVIAGGRVESNRVSWGGSGSGGGSGTGTGTGTGGGDGGSGNGSSTGAHFYSRTAAVQWAVENYKHRPLIQNGKDCTWFVSQALWAGGLPSSSTWTRWSPNGVLGTNGIDIIKALIHGGYSPTDPVNPTPTATYANLLPKYLEDQGLAKVHKITWSDNTAYGAQLGDLIAYDWDGGSDGSIDHLAIVTKLNSRGYPYVSQHSSNRLNRYWSWDPGNPAANPPSPAGWIENTHPATGHNKAPIAYLIHITY